MELENLSAGILSILILKKDEKILNFIKSFQYIGLGEKFKIIVFGPEAKSYLKYFKRNFYYIEPTKKTIFNFKLIIPCFFYFIFFY